VSAAITRMMQLFTNLITKSLGHVGQDAAIVQLHAACSGNMVLVS